MITPEEFAAKMQEIVDMNDPEIGHCYADSLMEETLEALGFGKGIEISSNMTKWYA